MKNVLVCCCFAHLGPKHMQRLARYPLLKANGIMNMMKNASWWNKTGRWTRGSTLHNMKSGMKRTRHTIIPGSNRLSFPGCKKKKKHKCLTITQRQQKNTTNSLQNKEIFVLVYVLNKFINWVPWKLICLLTGPSQPFIKVWLLQTTRNMIS